MVDVVVKERRWFPPGEVRCPCSVRYEVQYVFSTCWESEQVYKRMSLVPQESENVNKAGTKKKKKKLLVNVWPDLFFFLLFFLRSIRENDDKLIPNEYRKEC